MCFMFFRAAKRVFMFVERVFMFVDFLMIELSHFICCCFCVSPESEKCYALKACYALDLKSRSVRRGGNDDVTPPVQAP